MLRNTADSFLFDHCFRYRKPKYKPLTSEGIARAFTETRRKAPPMDQVSEHVAEETSSRREEIARGKKPVQSIDEEPLQPDGEHPSGEEEQFAEPAVRNVNKRTKPKKLPPPNELIEILMSMDFKGTRYPHHQTMKDLGIYRDVEYLLDMCHLGTFMGFQFEAHQEETCHFLATLAVHFYDDIDPEAEEDPGLGYITFSVKGEECSITIKELDTLFSFPNGTMVDSIYDEKELNELWLTIAGPSKYISGRSKSSAIRSPVLRYVHKAIASTMYARKVTGNVNQLELEMLDGALTGLMSYTRSGKELIGNKADTSLTCQLLDQLLSYKEWACKVYRSNKSGELSIGGVITPILAACGVELDGEGVEPRWIDMPHLIKSGIIAKEMVNGQYLYRFFHQEASCTKMMPLPCPSHTTVRMGNNIDFCPPTVLLYPREQEEAPIAEQEEEHQHRPDQVDAEDNDLQDSPLEEFKGHTLQDAHRHISRLRKWSIKTIKALQKTVSVMGNQIKELQGKAKEAPAPAPITGLNILRRSGSTSIAPRRNIRMEPPRASSFEPREQPERQWQFQTPSSTGIDQLLPPEPPAPTYTRESMEQSIDSFFTQP